ncbi:response regulator transcription factor [Kitasatospora indigofera]
MTLSQAATVLKHSVQTVTYTVRRLVARFEIKGDRAQLIHEAYCAGVITPRAPLHAPPADITPRRREVLRMVASGQSYSAIAQCLQISVDSVLSHVEALRRDLGARSRVELVSAAWSHRLLGPGDGPWQPASSVWRPSATTTR